MARRGGALLCLALVLTIGRTGGAEQVAVPVAIQAELLAKVASYDRRLVERAQGHVHVLVLTRIGNDDSARAATQLVTALHPLADIGAMPHVPSVAAVADYVPRGMVLGFDLTSGKPTTTDSTRASRGRGWTAASTTAPTSPARWRETAATPGRATEREARRSARPHVGAARFAGNQRTSGLAVTGRCRCRPGGATAWGTPRGPRPGRPVRGCRCS
jgi:hypothetical protein